MVRDEDRESMVKQKSINRVVKIVILIIIVVLGIQGCIPRNRSKIAVKLLEEKYGEKFSVKENRGKDGLLSEKYKIVAYSNNYPDVLFEATVANNGSYIMDEYVASRVCREVEQGISSNLSGLPEAVEIQVKVQAVSNSIDTKNADMDIWEFMTIKTKNRFAIYLIVSTEKQEEAENLYYSLEQALSGFECMSGEIQLYFTNESTFAEVQTYLNNTANLDYEFEVALGHIMPIIVPFENGVIQLQQQKLVQLL